MKNENYDDIKSLFGEETKLPAELSKENVTKKLSMISPKKKSNIKAFSKFAAAAAAVLIAVVGVSQIGNIDRNVNVKPVLPNQPAPQYAVPGEKTEIPASIAYAPIDLGLEKSNLTQFSDSKDLENYFQNLAKKYQHSNSFNIKDFFFDYKSSYSALDVSAVEEVNGAFATTSAAADSAPAPEMNATDDSVSPQETPYGSTNTQVTGVDEADIIKNDGRYIYIISEYSLLTIVDTNTMEAVFSKKIEANGKNKFLAANDIYVGGNTLVVVADEYEQNKQSGIDEEVYYGANDVYCLAYMPNSNVVNIVFDISDKANPKETKRFTQNGTMQNTRMVGSVLYTVTNYAVRVDEKDKVKEECYPKVDGKKADINSVYVVDKERHATSYIVLSAFDTANISSEVNSISVLGYSDQLYCTSNKMYIIDNSASYISEKNIETNAVNIYSFSLDGTKLSFKASGAVPGYVNEQYFIDEFEGYLRIATNNYDYNEDKDVSSLYALDSELNVVGKLENFADDEQIKSVRFMGDTAYVVTFRNTDPLFAIDMSNLSKMKVLGEVKLPGYSEYMHSVGDGLLVGIGYDGDEENANFDTVKITLFDVSDKTNPKVLDTHVIKSATTDVNYNPKAFFFYAEEDIIGIPLSYYNVNGVSSQFKLLKIENGKFVDKHNYAHPNDFYGSAIFRGSYIGDKLYTITSFSVAQFDIKSGELLKTLTYATREDYMPDESIGITQPALGVYNGSAVVTATTQPSITTEIYTENDTRPLGTEEGYLLGDMA